MAQAAEQEARVKILFPRRRHARPSKRVVVVHAKRDAAEIRDLRDQVRTLTRYARELEDELARSPGEGRVTLFRLRSSTAARPAADEVEP